MHTNGARAPRVVITAFSVLLALFAGATPATAQGTHERLVSGTFAVTNSAIISTQQVGADTVIVLQQVVQWSGPIRGTAQETLIIIAPSAGDSTFYGVDVCACKTQMGASGVVTIGLSGRDNGTSFHGHLKIVHTTGALSGLDGHATFQGTDAPPVSGTYSGTFE